VPKKILLSLDPAVLRALKARAADADEQVSFTASKLLAGPLGLDASKIEPSKPGPRKGWLAERIREAEKAGAARARSRKSRKSKK
jgi:hypothetical protein